MKRPRNDDHSRLDVVYKHVGIPLGDTTISIRAKKNDLSVCGLVSGWLSTGTTSLNAYLLGRHTSGETHTVGRLHGEHLQNWPGDALLYPCLEASKQAYVAGFN